MEFGSEAANFVRNNFYVDDGLLSVKTDEEAISLIENTKKLLAKCGLRLHKFLSNSNTVIESVPVVDRAKVLQNHDLFFEDSPIERCLGLQWCIESDTFQFRICLKDQPLTRRGILSTVSSIYDPLRLISPVILDGKQILQELCRAHNDWDSDIPDILRFRWEKWRSSLSQLADVKIERCYKPKDFGDIVVNELHHFSDASTFGYGQCSYLRLIDNNSNVSCSLVMSKSRVTPLKPITIPRLELAAALVSVRVSLQLRRELNYRNLTEVFWSDSKVVLGYINNDARRFQMFVANRIQQIRESSNPTQWRYIKSKDNLADLASRGVTAEELNATKWFIGPDFLWKSQLPSTSDNPEEMHVNISSDDPELKKVQSLATNAKPCFELSRLNHISDWFKAKRMIALCLRFRAILLSKVKDFPDQPLTHSPLTVEELRCSELQIIKLVQAEAFAEELKILKAVKLSANKEDIIRLKKSSSLYKLDPFLNSDNVICVGGRLKRATCDQLDKYPVILPKKHYITNMIVRYFHSIVEHQGRGITTNEIRASGYWIIGCTSVVSSHILRCVLCRKLRGRSQEQKMSDLPEDRLETAPPFSYCGMDCFGPWYVKEGRKEIKRYGLLFVCMASRAILIETLNDLSTDAFINGLRRFQCIRGPIRQLRCDNGTNFIGAKRELHQAFHEMDSGRIQKYLVENGCDYFQFKTNVPNASHMGGVWERHIRSIRNVLSSLLLQNGSQLDDDSLRTFMYKAMSIINSRPLTVDNLNDVNSLTPLTPNNILTMKSKIILPPPGEFQKPDLYSRKRWRRVQCISNEFWSRWKQEYLQNQQVRQKWNRETRDMHCGDIVLVVDDKSARNQWSLGRIIETYKDKDNHVRTVKLLVGDKKLNAKGKRVYPRSVLERPIQKLILILEHE